MAEQIPYSVAASLVNKLTSLASSDSGRINDVKGELERLKVGFESIKAALPYADNKQEQDRGVQDWIRKVKDVLLPADDFFDDFDPENSRPKGDIAGQVRNFIAFRFRTAPEIKKIEKNVNEIVDGMSRLNLSQSRESARSATSSFVSGSDIIGRDYEKREIVSQLMQPHGNENVSVIGIVGLGGIGKTTVAQMIYRDEEVKRFFEKHFWVYVSDNFDVKSIVGKIVESCTGSESNGQESLEDLLNKLHENLNGKKYLLVLDEIWNESREKWIELKTYLMCGAQGSKILVTTRSTVVAEVMGVNFLIHLEVLSEEDSWSLFKKLAFTNDGYLMNPSLEPVARKIAIKCRGVPLAIRTVANMLRDKYEKVN